MNLKEIWTMLRETVQDWSEDKAPRLAAALSYYTVFSLAPLLVLVIAITGFIIGNNDQIRQQIITQIQGMVGPQGAETVQTLIENTTTGQGGLIATVVGIATLLLGATGLFGQLQDALNTIWEVEPKEGRGVWGVIKDRFLSFTMVLGISFLLLVSLVISAALSFMNNYFTGLLGGFGLVAQALNILVSLGVITLIFATMFKVLPDVEIAWGDVWIGGLVTAVLFTIGKQLISLYLGSSSASSVYGAAGSLVIILLWVYYSAQILFFGAEFTQVYARRHGSRLAPSENAQLKFNDKHARERLAYRESQVEHLRQAMVPVTAQPAIHERREVIRYEPPNPAVVVPVVAAGALAGAYTIFKVIRKMIP